MLADDEILKEFLVESHENLDQLDQDFVALEREPNDQPRISAIFRTVHTIKGSSGFLGFASLEALTHAGEGLLALMRDGKMRLDSESTSALLAMVDGVRRILANVESTGEEGDESFDALRERLQLLQRSVVAAPAPAVAPPRAPAPVVEAPQVVDIPAIVDASAEPPCASDDAAPLPQKASHDGSGEQRQAAAEANIRVDVGLLDKLMNLVGELVLARNQIVQFGAGTKDAGFLGASQRLDLITTELQEGVMKTRMQPIRNIWSKFPRVVRDLGVICGKEVRLEMFGNETELDRTIVEAIKDPLTHAVRNAIDHGVEAPAVRRAAGKSPVGTLTLRAFHEGGKVNIEISDDGAGIDPEKIRDKIVQRGFVSRERAARMSERELHDMVFTPGFSTAERVSNVSGRGVGMDVVKTNIEKIGGTVEIKSSLGAGTSLKIRIPLTLAIIPALIVGAGGERYAIPQVSLLELVRLDGEPSRARVERIRGTPVYRLRGNLLPLVYLSHVLGQDGAAPRSDVVNIVVLQADDRQFGLVVDCVNDTEEIVVKPLDKELKSINVFAGATIMGDGRVALILDVLGIAQRANVISQVREHRASEVLDDGRIAQEARESLLLFDIGAGSRMAIPLSLVARLEEFPRRMIERAGHRAVVQYRGEILPLISLSEVLGGRVSTDVDGVLQVVVYSENDKRVGLIVDRILDIVDEHVTVKLQGSGDGLRGAAVIQGKVTDLLDVRAVMDRVDPTFFYGAA